MHQAHESITWKERGLSSRNLSFDKRLNTSQSEFSFKISVQVSKLNDLHISVCSRPVECDLVIYPRSSRLVGCLSLWVIGELSLNKRLRCKRRKPSEKVDPAWKRTPRRLPGGNNVLQLRECFCERCACHTELHLFLGMRCSQRT